MLSLTHTEMLNMYLKMASILIICGPFQYRCILQPHYKLLRSSTFMKEKFAFNFTN